MKKRNIQKRINYIFSGKILLILNSKLFIDILFYSKKIITIKTSSLGWLPTNTKNL